MAEELRGEGGGGVRGVRGLLVDKVVCRPELWGDGSVCIVIFAYQYAWQRPACQEFVLQFFCLVAVIF